MRHTKYRDKRENSIFQQSMSLPDLNLLVASQSLKQMWKCLHPWSSYMNSEAELKAESSTITNTSKGN